MSVNPLQYIEFASDLGK